jgi:hypothetical protein
MWEYRGGELFGGTFGVGYAGFLFSTALILKFFAGPIIATAGAASFDHAFAAWLILWALVRAPRQLRRGLSRRRDRPQCQHGQGTPAALPDEARPGLTR